MIHSLLFSTNARTRLVRRLAFALLVAVLCAPGCSAKKPKSLVKGKITLGNDPVMGEVVFVDENGKELQAAPLSDGNYTMVNAPKGKYKILVRMPGGLKAPTGGSLIAPKEQAGAMKEAGLLAGSTAKAPPDKFGNVQTTTLTIEVEVGEQTKDFDLSKL